MLLIPVSGFFSRVFCCCFVSVLQPIGVRRLLVFGSRLFVVFSYLALVES